MAIDVGQEAPDFELRNQFGETVRLSHVPRPQQRRPGLLPEGLHADVHR